jgi:polar amino acid transport system substrate-binding protein
MGIALHSFFVSKESSWKFEGLKSLHNVTLGVIRDYSYGTLYDEYIQKNEDDPKRLAIVSGKDPLMRVFRMLSMGRINVLVEDKNVMAQYFGADITKNTFKEAGIASTEKVYVAFSPSKNKSAEYSAILDSAVDELRDSGQLDKILFKYGLEAW